MERSNLHSKTSTLPPSVLDNSYQNDSKEFEFHQKEFEFIAAMLYEFSGIVLKPEKKTMVYARLVRRLRALNFNSFKEYCDFLKTKEGYNETTQLVNSLTTNLTKFFREDHHFQHLTSTVLPMISEKHKGAKSKPRVRIWSAGCSSGEEPYSIAMSLLENSSRVNQWDVKILATDIDTQMVNHGHQGIYKDNSGIPQDCLTKYCEQRNGEVHLKNNVKNMITFKQLNLHGHWPFSGPFDIIFCRNVVIYFDKETQKKLFYRFADVMEPGTYLYIGHSESMYQVCDAFELVGKTTYRRKG